MSGQVVKPAQRPYSRRKYHTMPEISTCSKSVHFSDDTNETRHFLRGDTPNAAVVDPSRRDTSEDTSLRMLHSFGAIETYEQDAKAVQLEHLILSPDQQALNGTCTVRNLCFHKRVAIRFTMDGWTTVSEVEAEYYNSVKNPLSDRGDRFTFDIKLPHYANTERKVLLLCIKYNAGGEEFWDNNDNINYRVDLKESTHQPPPPIRLDTLEPVTQLVKATQHRRGSLSFVLGELVAKSASTSDLDAACRNSESSPEARLFSNGKVHTQAPITDSIKNALVDAPRAPSLPTSPDGPDSMPTQRPTYIVTNRKTNPARRTVSSLASTSCPVNRPAMGPDQYRRLLQQFCYFVPAPKTPPGGATEMRYQTAASGRERLAV
ncbi:hypothetical protein LTR78_010969 [Recurvomyces mirabilis]|uniref:CBM21 domain-containing protein n=1 Tax=Recurvomyces mirabilis TaxID=574656 RepID=A0AAE0TLT2_9PEZI|nr:hypothetical protein LTR78_010969 [Recurvomyces mirabilis]KAK5149453.1 hypothetical protein LTS14_010915 [Recurvomyces mirabilis]